MLLLLHPDSPISAIFTALNEEMMFFLGSSVAATSFVRELFSEQVGEIVWNNAPTKEKFEALWKKLAELSEEERGRIERQVGDYQNLSSFFGVLDGRPPAIAEAIAQNMQALTRHLFSRTSHLTGIEAACDETITRHYASFRRLNGKVCCACGMHVLSEFRANVADEDQWRSAFDHILALTHYPSYGVHAKNLIPCCDHCNSKAKGSKDVLRNGDQSPRLAFDPRSESCHESVAVELEFGEVTLVPLVRLRSDDLAVQQKINTWNSVYLIKDRIEGSFLDWAQVTDVECPVSNLTEWRGRLREAGERRLGQPTLDGLYFWRGLFYTWAASLDDAHLRILHEAILMTRNDQGNRQVFGI